MVLRVLLALPSLVVPALGECVFYYSTCYYFLTLHWEPHPSPALLHDEFPCVKLEDVSVSQGQHLTEKQSVNLCLRWTGQCHIFVNYGRDPQPLVRGPVLVHR